MHGRRLSAATIRKEIVSLGTAWNWTAEMGLVSGRHRALRGGPLEAIGPARGRSGQLRATRRVPDFADTPHSVAPFARRGAAIVASARSSALVGQGALNGPEVR